MRKFIVHKLQKDGSCRSCKSKKCRRTAYIPYYPEIWSWERIYKNWMQGISPEELEVITEYQRRAFWDKKHKKRGKG